MPLMVTMIVNPNPPDEIKSSEEFKWAKTYKPRFDTPMVNANEILRSQSFHKTPYYVIEPKNRPKTVNHRAAGVPVEQMDRKALMLAAMNMGVTVRNKAITTDKLRALVQKSFDDIVNAVEDLDEVEDGDEPEAADS